MPQRSGGGLYAGSAVVGMAAQPSFRMAARVQVLTAHHAQFFEYGARISSTGCGPSPSGETPVERIQATGYVRTSHGLVTTSVSERLGKPAQVN